MWCRWPVSHLFQREEMREAKLCPQAAHSKCCRVAVAAKNDGGCGKWKIFTVKIFTAGSQWTQLITAIHPYLSYACYNKTLNAELLLRFVAAWPLLAEKHRLESPPYINTDSPATRLGNAWQTYISNTVTALFAISYSWRPTKQCRQQHTIMFAYALHAVHLRSRFIYDLQTCTATVLYVWQGGILFLLYGFPFRSLYIRQYNADCRCRRRVYTHYSQ